MVRWRHFNKMSICRWVQCLVLLAAVCLASLTGADSPIWCIFQNGPIVYLRRRRLAAVIRAFHEAGLWNHFQEIARYERAQLLAVWPLMEGFGHQERPSVSEAVWFIVHPRQARFCHHAQGDCVPLHVANTTQPAYYNIL